MSFEYTSAYIGPYCVSLARGKAGQSQRFRFPIPFKSMSDISQGLLILEGRIHAAWDADEESAVELGPGQSFSHDLPGRKNGMSVNDGLTLIALEDCAYLCISAVGIEQKVRLGRYWLNSNEQTVTERYSLIAVAGSDALTSINGAPPQKGARLIYARSTELGVTAHSKCVIGKFYFEG